MQQRTISKKASWRWKAIWISIVKNQHIPANTPACVVNMVREFLYREELIILLIMLLSTFVSSHCSAIGAEGSSLMMKLESDHIQITPRNWRTFKRVPRELLIAKLCDVISAPFTVYERAVTSCAALFSWCNRYTCKVTFHWKGKKEGGWRHS